MITDEILIASEEEDLDLVEEAREEADGCRRFHVPEVVADVAVALDPTGLVLRGMEGGDNICTLNVRVDRCRDREVLGASSSRKLDNRRRVGCRRRSCRSSCRLL
jgi:hypothetical protein